jgi:hypothetical protein
MGEFLAEFTEWLIHGYNMAILLLGIFLFFCLNRKRRNEMKALRDDVNALREEVKILNPEGKKPIQTILSENKDF